MSKAYLRRVISIYFKSRTVGFRLNRFFNYALLMAVTKFLNPNKKKYSKCLNSYDLFVYVQECYMIM